MRCHGALMLIVSGGLILGSNGCEQNDPDHASSPGFVESESGELPDCCAPDEGTIDRTLREESASAQTLLEAKVDELIEDAVTVTTEESVRVQVGSIQTSIDPNIVGTIIGRRVDFDLNFTNQDGEPINLAKDYAGKTIVLSTVFTSCPTPEACPRIADDFAQMAQGIPASLRDKIQLVLVSFDPSNDTPAVLNLWGRNHGIDSDRVDLLTSDIETVKQLMEQELEIPIMIDPASGRFSNHALMVHVINADGRLVVERTARNSAVFDTVLLEAIRAATMDFVAPESSG